jgi:hypothetical protein
LDREEFLAWRIEIVGFWLICLAPADIVLYWPWASPVRGFFRGIVCLSVEKAEKRL